MGGFPRIGGKTVQPVVMRFKAYGIGCVAKNIVCSQINKPGATEIYRQTVGSSLLHPEKMQQRTGRTNNRYISFISLSLIFNDNAKIDKKHDHNHFYVKKRFNFGRFLDEHNIIPVHPFSFGMVEYRAGSLMN